MIEKRLLARVGEAAIKATMTDAEVRRAPGKAFAIAMAAMRAAIGASLAAEEVAK